MPGYRASIEQRNVRSFRGGKYEPWGERYDNNMVGVYRDDQSPDVNSNLDIPEGTATYVVWVEYSYGDSFGIAEKAGVVGVFRDEMAANELRIAIEQHRPDRDTSDWENKYRLKLSTSDGQDFDIYTGSWHDYFGGLQDVHVDALAMGQ